METIGAQISVCHFNELKQLPRNKLLQIGSLCMYLHKSHMMQSLYVSNE